MHAAAIVMLSLAVQAAPAKEPEPTLKPLCEVAKRLDDGIKEFINGKKEAKEIWKNWFSPEWREDDEKKLREDLVTNHVVAARTFAIDLRLHFFEAGAKVYEVQALIRATPTEASLLAYRGRASKSTGKPSIPPDKLSKDAKPFGDAGLALLKALKTKKRDDLPFADEEEMNKLVPATFRGMMKKAREETKASAETTQKELNELKYDEVKIALDEYLFTPFGVEGLAKEGIIRGKMKFSGEGEVMFRFAGYETK